MKNIKITLLIAAQTVFIVCLSAVLLTMRNGLLPPFSSVGVQGNTGAVGTQGLQGIQGATGVPGTDGASIQGPKGDTGDAGATGPVGPKGDQGNTGPAGQQIELRKDPDTGQLECRFVGDTAWTPITDSGNICP